MCSISANLDSAQRSSVGILQRMPKPGSFASITCTLSEHLKSPAEGLPSLRGRGVPEITIEYSTFIVRNPLSMQPLGEGARQRRRMDAAQPLSCIILRRFLICAPLPTRGKRLTGCSVANAPCASVRCAPSPQPP